jgi:ubiquinone/menaquinone biosynthesis C-methylase UbiE
MRHKHPGGLFLTQRLLNYCSLNPGARVVDIGCGTGETIWCLHTKYDIDAIGVDLSSERLKEARTVSLALKLLLASAENLPLPDASMDTVIAECSLSVMQDPESAIAEASRILVSGGKLAISDVYARSHSLSSVFLTHAALAEILSKYGFNIVVWEDHFKCLAEFTASFIMEHGAIEKLWQEHLSAKNCRCDDLKSHKLSYFLLVAEKIN